MPATSPEDTIPTFSKMDEKNEYIEECFEHTVPAFFVNKVGRRTWASVECDMISTSGWTTVEISGEEADVEARLTTDGVAKVNEIADSYREVELDHSKTVGALSTKEGATFMSFPAMRPDVAQDFADELKEVFLDESYWRIPQRELDRQESV